MNELVLAGCKPEPMMCYLKALGVLRLVAEQKDPSTRGCWKNEKFYLHTTLAKAELVGFFLDEYRPTPVLAPWGARTGFYGGSSEKAARESLSAIRSAADSRFAIFREGIDSIQALLKKMGVEKKPKGNEKVSLLRACRACLPESMLPWFDAAYVLTTDSRAFPPLLGTGGNEGSTDFTSNFMQHLKGVLIDRKNSRERLEYALFAVGSPPLVKGSSPSQFYPGGVGAPNATQGFEADSLVNPWDYILMIEGTLLFAGAVARRLNSETRGRASFPFTVTPSPVGYGSAAEIESTPDRCRAEIWLPLWGRPATSSEVAYLLAEGRAQVGRRQVRSGVEFARAVAGLGVDRGINAFQRFGFLRRSGKNYLAVPIGRIAVVEQPQVNLLNELDPWLDRLRRACQEKETPERYRTVLRSIDRAIFEFCTRDGARCLQGILISLGNAERAISTGRRIRQSVSPLHHLTPRWIKACDDSSPEFRLATALASIKGDLGGKVGSFRAHLEPVTWTKGSFEWSDIGHSVVWGVGDLVRNLGNVLDRRCVEARMRGLDYLPLYGRINASLADVHRFLTGQVDEGRLADLIWALATVRWWELKDEDRPYWLNERTPTLARAYALLKLLFLPGSLKQRGGSEGVPVKPEPTVLTLLRAGRIGDACAVASRRLRASGVAPLVSDFQVSGAEAQRMGAALLIPVWETEHLAGLVLQPVEEVS